MRILTFAALPLLAIAAAAPAQERQKMSPSQIVAAAPTEAWVEIPANDILILGLEDDRTVYFQLAPHAAPQHVQNIRALADSEYWEGASVYRVQDNFVAQFGLRDIKRDLPEGVIAQPEAEYVFSGEGLDMRRLGYPDPYSLMAGFSGGWPVALYEDGTASLTHCYGTLGVGRELSPSTGDGTELYVIIGQAPRHLDRNIAIVGRAIEGIEHLSSLPRGTNGPLGMYAQDQVATPIVSYTMASTMPEEIRPRFEYLSEKSEAFAAYVDRWANRYDQFYEVSAGGMALCHAPVPVRRVKG
ncbi:MAG: peptidylprolyl isomerase [Sphingomonas sp.]|nr:peptidylprolyl isomerase [Sphingomonas sp.]RZV51094.1 MAG: peptidylprolyl isomerase [Sphingomonadaceae bacterium]